MNLINMKFTDSNSPSPAPFGGPLKNLGLVVFDAEDSGAEAGGRLLKCLVRLKPDTGQVNLPLWTVVVTL